MVSAVLALLLALALARAADEESALCMCVDTIANFTARASSAFKDDLRHRREAEQAIGPATRTALTNVWQSVRDRPPLQAGTASLLRTYADNCNVRIDLAQACTVRQKNVCYAGRCNAL